MTELFRLHQNPRSPRPSGGCAHEFSAEKLDAARKEISSWRDYRPTPLISLSGLAKAKGVGAILYKDEGARFGLGSFKALGGAYAVCRLLQSAILDQTGISASSEELRQGRFRSITETITVATATDGNHGRSVAWGAHLFHCACVVYVPHSCSLNRELAIARYGAQVRRSSFGYDETVRQCLRDAANHKWLVVSDTSWEGYEKIPATVMQGYTVMTGEVLDQLPVGVTPTHAIVQAGVGGLAAAVHAHFCNVWGSRRPRLIVVEPSGAAGLFESALAGKPVRPGREARTIMAGLEANEVSLVAWKLLAEETDFFMTIPDSVVPGCMRLLASSPYGDPPIVAGESAVGGLAALLHVLDNDTLRGRVELDSKSSVLLFGTEGDTDPDIYYKLAGVASNEVRSRVASAAPAISDSGSAPIP
jgi:diaminopropionate ammonia-lyase